MNAQAATKYDGYYAEEQAHDWPEGNLAIRSAIERQAKVIDELRNLADRLHQRLVDVLEPATPTAAGDAGDAVTDSRQAAMAAVLDMHTRSVAETAWKIEGMLDRLAL